MARTLSAVWKTGINKELWHNRALWQRVRNSQCFATRLSARISQPGIGQDGLRMGKPFTSCVELIHVPLIWEGLCYLGDDRKVTSQSDANCSVILKS